MSRLEKISWFNIAIFGISFLLFFISLFIYYPHHSLSMSLLMAAKSVAILALIALGPVIFREKSMESGEKSTLIQKNRRRKRCISAIMAVFIGVCVWIWVGYFQHMSFSERPDLYMIFIISAGIAAGLFFTYIFLNIQEKSLISNEKYGLFEVMIYGPIFDERDFLISRRAARYGLSAFWIYFYGAAVGAWIWASYMKYSTITIHKDLVILHMIAGVIIYVFITSLVTIIFSRKGN